MSLVPCKECGNQISTLAPTCPHCGVPRIAPATQTVKSKPKSKPIETAIGAVFFLALVYGLIQSSGSKSETQGCAVDDLQCLGDKLIGGAGTYCMRPIERLATHSVKWTDGTMEPKFSRFRWANKSLGAVTMVGDRAEFQNGFGAYTPVIYECDLAKDGKTILDVRVREGRLPDLPN